MNFYGQKEGTYLQKVLFEYMKIYNDFIENLPSFGPCLMFQYLSISHKQHRKYQKKKKED